MKAQWLELTCEIELSEGERLTLPESLAHQIGPGRWIITVQPAGARPPSCLRDHRAFLNSYSRQDDGLYDDAARG